MRHAQKLACLSRIQLKFRELEKPQPDRRDAD